MNLTRHTVLNWPIRPRDTGAWRECGLPSAIRTRSPSFRHPDLPDEVALLLPNRGSHAEGALPLTGASDGEDISHVAFGLFMAGPFLAPKRVLRALRESGAGWVANLPSVQMQDVEFEQQLGDVNIDTAREARNLRFFADEGLHIMAVVSDDAGVDAFTTEGAQPEIVVVMPRVAEFAAGFPSMRQRGTAATGIAVRLHDAGWRGSLLLLGTQQEAEHPSLWPEVADGLLCRPDPLGARQADRP
jgi:hypothetical protein